jgi:hypothetical protein
MIHERQRLPLRLEAGNDLAGVHPGLDDFQRDFAANRMLLLGHENDAESPLTDLLQKLVGADERAQALADGNHALVWLQEITGSCVGSEELFNRSAQFRIAGTYLLDKGRTLGGRRFL